MKIRFLALLLALCVVCGCSSRDRREAKAFVRSLDLAALRADLTAALADGTLTLEEIQKSQASMAALEKLIAAGLAKLEEDD